ncbi:hypothetical protein [Motilimonas pumila]|uniref:Uncharacterized protein n=1 Tax=Motilimonas pumila TaxID=2303987 RepID=A0A418YFA8_9GAMM|nr:hypothetical protein [Motilimonas pumila]RJG47962.1 hypothetical protein D1Z90_09625 [Motilimonas pumila]
MKPLILGLALIGISAGVCAENLALINQSQLDASALLKAYQQHSGKQIELQQGGIADLVSGKAGLLLSSKKWSDEILADYFLNYGEKPVQLTLAAFNPEAEVSEQQKAELFSTRAGQPLLYLYVNKTAVGQAGIEFAKYANQQGQDNLASQGLVGIPSQLQQSNRVSLGLASPQFEGGYR